MNTVTEILPLLLILLAIGGIAGVLAGLLGVGGGIILVPAFFYIFSWLGYGSTDLMQICLATSLATIIVTSLSSVRAHSRLGNVDWNILKTWAPGIAIGALCGVVIASRLGTPVLQGIFGLLGITIGLYMAFGDQGWRLGSTMPTGLKRAVISPVVGFLSVLMGIGGGSFGVPIMALHGLAIHRAVATAAGFGLIIAVPSTAGFLVSGIDHSLRPPGTIGAVNLPAFLVIVPMTLITAPIGARLAHSMDAKKLRRVFAVFLIVVALNMLRKSLGL